jgi:hypothetical protein
MRRVVAADCRYIAKLLPRLLYSCPAGNGGEALRAKAGMTLTIAPACVIAGSISIAANAPDIRTVVDARTPAKASATEGQGRNETQLEPKLFVYPRSHDSHASPVFPAFSSTGAAAIISGARVFSCTR